MKTAEGRIAYRAPQVTGLERSRSTRSFGPSSRSGLRRSRISRSRCTRGLSTRDIEAAFRDEDGRSLLSRTAVSDGTEKLWEEYEAFATRGLSESSVPYLFADRIAERLHTGQRRETVLCASGITDEGQELLQHLAPGTDLEPKRSFFALSPGQGCSASPSLLLNIPADLWKLQEQFV